MGVCGGVRGEGKIYPGRFERFEFEGAFEAFARIAELPFAVVDEGSGLLKDGVWVFAWGDSEL